MTRGEKHRSRVVSAPVLGSIQEEDGQDASLNWGNSNSNIKEDSDEDEGEIGRHVTKDSRRIKSDSDSPKRKPDISGSERRKGHSDDVVSKGRKYMKSTLEALAGFCVRPPPTSLARF